METTYCTLKEYVELIFNLFDLFEKYRTEKGLSKKGHPFTYPEAIFIIFL